MFQLTAEKPFDSGTEPASGGSSLAGGLQAAICLDFLLQAEVGPEGLQGSASNSQMAFPSPPPPPKVSVGLAVTL